MSNSCSQREKSHEVIAHSVLELEKGFFHWARARTWAGPTSRVHVIEIEGKIERQANKSERCEMQPFV